MSDYVSSYTIALNLQRVIEGIDQLYNVSNVFIYCGLMNSCYLMLANVSSLDVDHMCGRALSVKLANDYNN